jgi:hypothetical protein
MIYADFYEVLFISKALGLYKTLSNIQSIAYGYTLFINKEIFYFKDGKICTEIVFLHLKA